MKNIKDLETIRDYIDKLINEANEYLAHLNEEIAENEKKLITF